MTALAPLATVLLALAAFAAPTPVQARTVYRCVQKGTVSLATAPEPGSRCVAKQIPDDAARVPNLWGALGVVRGTLYKRVQDGRVVYSTRNLPGSVKLLSFTARTPPPTPAHLGLGRIGKPRLDAYATQFRAAAKATGVEDAWLRAIAHAESGFDPKAVSSKGAQGVMQLMPEVSAEYGVADPLSPGQSIDAGARHLKTLMRRYNGDLVLVAAAYNAGIGEVTRHDGVPPFPETQAYIAKVQILHERYRLALAKAAAASRP